MTEFNYETMKQSAKQILIGLGLPEQTHTRCLTILDDEKTKEILTELNVNGITVAAIYVAAILTENRITQQSLADIIGVAEATIRKYYLMLVKLLELKRRD